MIKRLLRDITEMKSIETDKDIEPNCIFISKTFNKKIVVRADLKGIKNISSYYAIKPIRINLYDLFILLRREHFYEWCMEHSQSTKNIKTISLKILSHYEIVSDIPVVDYSPNIKLINNFKLDDFQHLYKCMPLNRFLCNLQDNNLAFVAPDTWNDPYERRFLNVDFSALDFKPFPFYCMCLSQNFHENEEASWKMYSDNINDKAVQLTFYTEELLKELDAYARDNDYTIFIGKVSYQFSTKELKVLHKEKSKGNELYFPQNFKDVNYINLFLLKRPAFGYENEIRIFIVKKHSDNENKLILKIPVNFNKNQKLLKRIRLSPYPVFKYNDPRKEIYEKLQTTESSCVKKQIKAFLENVPITQSNLYVNFKKKIKIVL